MTEIMSHEKSKKLQKNKQDLPIMGHYTGAIKIWNVIKPQIALQKDLLVRVKIEAKLLRHSGVFL